MPSTLKQVRDDVRERLDEISETFWRDQRLNDWIHEGATDIAKRAQTLLDVRDLHVTANVQNVPAPTDTVRLDRIEWQPDLSTQRFTLTYVDWNVADGVWWTQQGVTTHPNPTIYTTWKMSPSMEITLYPTPSRDGTLRCYYYRLPIRAASDNDPVEVPEGWVNLVVHYVESIALRKDRDPRWQEAKQLYEEGLQGVKETLEKQTQSQGMIAAGRSIIPGWLYEMEGY